MATKVYAISGKTTVELSIPVGKKAFMPLVFDKGQTGRKNFRPATFSTNKKYVQDIIENSPYFGSMIKLYKVYGGSSMPIPKAVASPLASPEPAAPGLEDDPQVTPAIPAADDATPQVTEYPEVKTKEDAVAFLKARGAKATDLRDNKSLKKFATRIGVAFPNLNK